jgi:hypothetical protein
MAQTTTHISACDVAIWVDNNAGTPTDISGSTNSVNLTISATAEQMRTFGSRWPVRKSCPLDSNIEITVVYSTANDEGMDLIKEWVFGANPGEARTVSVYVPDKNVGSDRYYGEFVLDGDIEIPLEAGNAEPVSVTLPLSITGALSQTAAST